MSRKDVIALAIYDGCDSKCKCAYIDEDGGRQLGAYVEQAIQAWERTHVAETMRNANRVQQEHLDRLCFEVPVKPPARRRPGRAGHDDRYYRDLAKTHRALFRKLKRPPSIGELHRTFDGAAPPRSTLYRHLQTARERGYLA